MKKLSKDQAQEKARLAALIGERQEAVNAAVETYNNAVSDAKSEVEEAVAQLNLAIADATTFCEAIHDEQESYYDEKSEKWQEGDNGSAYSDWKDAWEVSFDEMNIDFPDELDAPDSSEISGAFEELPDEPG